MSGSSPDPTLTALSLEERLHLALEAADVGIWQYDPRTGETQWLERCRALMGVDEGLEPSYETFLEVVHPDDRARVRAHVERALEPDGDGLYRVEFRVLPRGGRWLLASGRVDFEGEGAARRPMRLAGILHDITERKEAELAREELLARLGSEQELLSAILQGMPDGLLIAEAPSGRIVMSNPQVERILRHPPFASEDVAAYRQWRGFHPDGRPLEAREWPLARALEGEQIRGEEIDYLRGDDTLGTIRINAGPIRGDDGAIRAAVVTFQDVTERKRAERERDASLAREREARADAERQRQRLHDLFLQAPAAVSVFRGPEFRYELANEPYRQLVGAQRELVGRTLDEAFPDMASEDRAVLESVYRTGEPVIAQEYPVTLDWDGDGRPATRHFNFAIVPIRDEHGAVVGLSNFAYDVTVQVEARRRIEAAEARSRFLAEASRVLVAALEPAPMLRRFAEMALPTLGDFCFFDVLSPSGEIERIAWTHVDPERQDWYDQVKAMTPTMEHGQHPVVRALRSRAPVFLPDTGPAFAAGVATRQEHRSFIEKIGVTSLLTVPLLIGDEPLGTLTFGTDGSSGAERRLDQADLELATELGQRAAAALQRARLLESERAARREAEAAVGRLRLLAEAGAVLSSSLDYHETLRAVARLAVPELADWCTVYLLDEAGDLRPLAVSHADPELEAKARALAERYLPRRDFPGGLYTALEDGATRVYELVSEESLRAGARDEAHVALLKELGFRVGVAVPLTSRGEAIGVMSLFASDLERRYGPDDVALAEELGRRAALAVDNARLYRGARELAETLEQRVTERTLELRTANLRLATANRELEAFTYSVSHDLRAPLRGIDGFSAALLEDYGGRLDDTAEHYLDRIRAAATRMGTLIDDLLALSRISRQPVERRAVDLSALAERILAELREREPERRVETRVAPGLRTQGDAGLLRVLLENLLGNAWKFTRGHDPAHIAFDAEARDGHVVYRIRDDGEGFDMDYAEKLFAPFQRLHSQEVYEGTGIGLATVQRIVHQHGGRIWAEGAVGEGATFYFTLEGEEAAVLEQAPWTPPPPPAGTEGDG